MANKNEIKTRTAHTPGRLYVRESAPGEAPSRKICGYAIMFNVPSVILDAGDRSEEREIITPGAISKDLLDSCDIIMTMYHNRQIVLARSKQGKGTLSYRIDSKGVFFEFEAPKTPHGDEALELVKRGDISGCSFIFSTYYLNNDYVECRERKENGITKITYYVKRITGIYDFTITTNPAYPDTSVEAREREQREARRREKRKAEQIRAIRERVNGKPIHAPKKTKQDVLKEIRTKIKCVNP